MKHLTTITLAVSLLIVLSAPVQSQILWRGAKTMSKGSVIVMAEYYYMDFTKT